MEFTVDRNLVDGVEALALEGRIDIFTAPILVNALTEVLVPGCGGAVLDIDGVDSLDSTGLGLLVDGLKRPVRTTYHCGSSARTYRYSIYSGQSDSTNVRHSPLY